MSLCTWYLMGTKHICLLLTINLAEQGKNKIKCELELRYHCALLKWILKTNKLTKPSACENVEGLKLTHRWWKCNVAWTLWKRVGQFYIKMKHAFSIQSSSHTPRKIKTHITQKLYVNVLKSSLARSHQELEITQISFNLMNGLETLLHLCNGLLLFSAKEEQMTDTQRSLLAINSIFVYWESISTSLLKIYFTTYIILGFFFLFFNNLNIPLHCLLAQMISEEKSDGNLIIVPGSVRCIFPSTFLQEFIPVSGFLQFHAICPGVLLCFLHLTCFVSELPGSVVWPLSLLLKSFQGLCFKYFFFSMLPSPAIFLFPCLL